MVVLMLLLMLLLLLLLILSGDLLLLLLLMILGVERAASAASSLVELLLCLELRSLLELFLMSMLVELVEADNEDHVSSHSQCRYLQGQRFPPRCRWSISGLHQTPTPNLRRQLLLLLELRSLVERAASAAAAASSLMELLLFLELRSLVQLILVSCLVELLILVEAAYEDRQDRVCSHSQCRYLQGPKFFLLCSASIAGLHHCTPNVYLSRFQLVLLL